MHVKSLKLECASGLSTPKACCLVSMKSDVMFTVNVGVRAAQCMYVRRSPFINKHAFETCDSMAERLRRSTRNRLGLSRVGSSPTTVDSFYPFCFWVRVSIPSLAFSFLVSMEVKLLESYLCRYPSLSFIAVELAFNGCQELG